MKLLHPAYLSNYRVRAYGSLSVKGPSERQEEHPRVRAGGNLRSEGSRSSREKVNGSGSGREWPGH